MKETSQEVKKHSDFELFEKLFELIIHEKARTWVFPTSFAVILSAVALPIVLKAEFNFELIMYITIFVF